MKIFHGNVHRAGEWTAYFNPKGGKAGKTKPHPLAKGDGVGGIKFKPLENSARPTALVCHLPAMNAPDHPRAKGKAE